MTKGGLRTNLVREAELIVPAAEHIHLSRYKRGVKIDLIAQ